MELSKNKTDSAQELNTKGCCFLCLETEENKINSGEVWHPFSIQCLLRHLQITSFDKQMSNRKDIEVDLCETCKNICRGFIKGLEELQKAQMKINYFLEWISKTISGSKKDSKRVQVYSKRMTGDPKALAQLAFVDDLRESLTVKSLAMQVGPLPRINLEKVKLKNNIKIKEEVNCTEESNDTEEDVFNNDNQETFEPEPAFPSLEPPPEIIKQEKEASCPIKETLPDKCRKSQNFCYKKIAGTGMYQCTKCNKINRHSGVIFYHYESVHLKKRYKCDICNLSSYARNSQLKLHQKTCRETLKERLAKEKERKEFKFVCGLCGKRFENLDGLGSHRRSVHKYINRYACNLCDKKYTKLCSLNRHKDSVHLGKVFNCKFCKKEIRSKYQAYRHEKICSRKMEIKTESEVK